MRQHAALPHNLHVYWFGGNNMRFEALAEFQEPTADHAKILDWAQRHKAIPAEVRTRVFDSQPSVLRFLFNDLRKGTPDLRPITWEDFFARFDLLHLSVLLDEAPAFEFVEVEQPNPFRLPAN